MARRQQNTASTFPSASQFSLHCWRPSKERWVASCFEEAAMMARYAGGRPGSSRRVHLVPVRHSGMDHRAVARIVLALARQMATEADEAARSLGVEAVSSGAGGCSMRELGTSDGQAAASGDAAAPWAGAHSGQSARGVASVGRCAANEPLSASPGSCLGRCAHQRHDGARHLAHGTPSATSPAVTDRAGAAESDEAAAPSSSTASHTVPDRAGAAEVDEAAAASSALGGTP